MDVKKDFQAPFRWLYFLSKSKEAWKCKHMVNKRDHSQHKKKTLKTNYKLQKYTHARVEMTRSSFYFHSITPCKSNLAT